MNKINVNYYYNVDWDEELNLVEINGPFSDTDEKMNQFASPMYFDGSDFFTIGDKSKPEDKGIEFDDDCVDTSVMDAAKIFGINVIN